tara:strand:+ start:31659 stop:31901 length:243 start_codon:yes stop_codon:yes gene_type:complete
MGYHIRPIQKGVLGTPSKIQEELDELKDAIEQDVKILAIVELSDIYGALEAVADSYGMTMQDLAKMHQCTKRAFLSGDRT